MFSMLSQAGENLGKLCENSQVGENPRLYHKFLLICSSSLKRLPRFSPGYEGTENMLYFFYKTITFRLKRKAIYEACIDSFISFMKLNFKHSFIYCHFVINTACKSSWEISLNAATGHSPVVQKPISSNPGLNL